MTPVSLMDVRVGPLSPQYEATGNEISSSNSVTLENTTAHCRVPLRGASVF